MELALYMYFFLLFDFWNMQPQFLVSVPVQYTNALDDYIITV